MLGGRLQRGDGRGICTLRILCTEAADRLPFWRFPGVSRASLQPREAVLQPPCFAGQFVFGLGHVKALPRLRTMEMYVLKGRCRPLNSG